MEPTKIKELWEITHNKPITYQELYQHLAEGLNRTPDEIKDIIEQMHTKKFFLKLGLPTKYFPQTTPTPTETIPSTLAFTIIGYMLDTTHKPPTTDKGKLIIRQQYLMLKWKHKARQIQSKYNTPTQD